MPNLYVTVYKGFSAVGHPIVPPVAEWSLEIGVGSNPSPPFPKNSHLISVKAGSACCLGFGRNAEAANGYHPLDTGEMRYYCVSPGDRIAVTVRSDEPRPEIPAIRPMPQPFT